MRRLPLATCALSAALLASAGSTARAQNAPPVAEEGEDALVRLNPQGPEGWEIKQLFQAVSDLTGASILYEEGNTTIRQKKITWVGTKVLRKRDVFPWLQAVLSYHGLVLVPVGPTGPGGEQQWFALDQANANLTSRPVYLDEKEVLDYEDRDGLYVVTSFELQNISDTSRVRQALSQLSTKTAGLGRINDVPGTRNIIVGDFAPIVAAMKRLLVYIDTVNVAVDPQMEVITLRHAVATELEPILQELIDQSGITRQQGGRQQQTPDEEPEPKIMADPRLDALIVYAVKSDMDKIKKLIEQLDIEANVRQRIHFRPLKHTDAEEMANLIQELISDTGVAGGSRSTSSSRRRSTNSSAQPNTPGAFGGGGVESEPVIIADKRSNSLIVHASPSQFDEIDGLIAKLDNSRPQVLIETALVELQLTDQLTIGTEIFSTSNNITVDTDGDGVADTLTNEQKYFSGSLFGIGKTITETINGVDVPTNRSPTLGDGLTAGIFKDGRMPILLSAFASSGRAKIVTMPSVVTNDNEEATLTLTRTTSFKQTVRNQNNDSTDSFDNVTATTELRISPTIASDNYLRLTLDQSVENFGARPSPDAPPDTTSRKVQTTVTVPDRYTVVLGGLVQREERSTVSKVPVLGDLPLVGWLFRSSDETSNPAHLFLFVTPRILRDTEYFNDYHRLTWEKKLLQDDLFKEPVHFEGQNFHGPNADESAEDRLRRLEESGALDGVRLKAPLSEQERIEMARRAAGVRPASSEQPAETPPAPPPAPAQPRTEDGGEAR